MTEVKDIKIDEYDYPLPDERIARYPLAERDASKLLILKDGILGQSHFRNIGDFLPRHSVLVCNETKVIHARLRFRKDEGAHIEIFCLEPHSESDYQLAFSNCSPVQWKCLVGNSKRWKSSKLQMGVSVGGTDCQLFAERISKDDDSSVVEFSWTPANLSFASVLDAAGEMPLPPYLHRNTEPNDLVRYQTVFAKEEGSVAAPTASLHMTKPLMKELEQQGHRFEHLTLHVGAGTFKPVSTDTIGEHAMHSETIIVERDTISSLAHSLDRTIIPIGTTSMRTLESLYWLGVQLIEKRFNADGPHIEQWYPYEPHSETGAQQALEAIVDYLDKTKQNELHATTALMIAPSYRIRIAKGIITNFHQPKSTLLLLVSALIGNKWKEAYDYALKNDFRFLSYGDSCLFLPENK